jgi:hypothetical protein
MNLHNTTPLTVATVLALDRNVAETLAVVVKGTYDVRNNRIRLHDQQEPVQVADTYRGDPAKSSMLRAGERSLHKTSTDVILVGSAYAEPDRPGGGESRQQDPPRFQDSLHP